jgi:hypothetical protein
MLEARRYSYALSPTHHDGPSVDQEASLTGEHVKELKRLFVEVELLSRT